MSLNSCGSSKKGNGASLRVCIFVMARLSRVEGRTNILTTNVRNSKILRKHMTGRSLIISLRMYRASCKCGVVIECILGVARCGGRRLGATQLQGSAGFRCHSEAAFSAWLLTGHLHELRNPITSKAAEASPHGARLGEVNFPA